MLVVYVRGLENGLHRFYVLTWWRVAGDFICFWCRCVSDGDSGASTTVYYADFSAQVSDAAANSNLPCGDSRGGSIPMLLGVGRGLGLPC